MSRTYSSLGGARTFGTLLALLLVAGTSGASLAGTDPGELTRPTVVNGVLLPAGTVITDTRKGRFSYSLSTSARINGWLLPPNTQVIHTLSGHVQYVLGAPAELAHIPFSDQSPVTFLNGKLDGRMDLSRDAVVGGFPCSDHYDVYFKAGRVIQCQLLRRTLIRGVPCAADDFGDDGTYLDCTLASAYRRFGYTWPARTRIEIVTNGTSHMTTGPRPPDLRFLGRPLPPGSDVGFDGATITLDLKGRVVYAGCHVTHVYAPPAGHGSMSASESSQQCLGLALPPNALSRAQPGR